MATPRPHHSFPRLPPGAVARKRVRERVRVRVRATKREGKRKVASDRARQRVSVTL